MKHIIYYFELIFIASVFLSCKNDPGKEHANDVENQAGPKIEIVLDSTKLKKSVLVLKIIKLEDGIGDKFIWDKVRLLDVLKNEMDYEISSEFEIAHYSYMDGIPDHECIAYLTYYPLGSKEPATSDKKWILLQGNGNYGIQKVDSVQSE